MIYTINDLVLYTKKYFIKLGSKEYFSDFIIDYYKGSPNKELGEYLNFLSKTYISIIESINITRSVIGYFNLSPDTSSHDRIENKILFLKKKPFFPKEFMEKHRMYQIGSYNTDLICITSGTNQFHDGEILFVEEGQDIYNPQDSQIHPLAKNFEEFLLIAGNLHQVKEEILEDDSNYQFKRDEFFNRMSKLKVDEKYQTFWGEFF